MSINYKLIFSKLGFTPKDNEIDVFQKKYIKHSGYCIEIDCKKKCIDYGDKIKIENKATQNFSQDENWVVLECVNRLLEKGYKPQNIILEKTWASGHGTSGRLDICVTRDNGSEYLLIECKTWGAEFIKESNRIKKDGGQLFTYFKFSNKADAIMLYASKLNKAEIIYQNEIVKIEDDYRAGDVKDFYDKWSKLTKDNGVFDHWVTPYEFVSKALTPDQLVDIKQEDSGFIFNRFLEILRHNVVSDKPNAFNKIFTLFLCKIYDEKTTPKNEELKFQWKEGVDNDIDFQMRLADLYRNGMYEFLDKKVTDFSSADFETKYKHLDEKTKEDLLKDIIKLRLEKNNEFAIKEVFDEKSFKENAKVIKQVVELLQGFKIRYTKKQQYLSDFFELLLTTGLKQESGQFFTPVPIAQFIIKSMPVDDVIDHKLKQGKSDDLLPYVIDYAAGSGHFLTEMMHEVQRIIDKKDSTKFIQDTAKKIKNWQEDHFDWALQYVYGIEKDYRLVKVGKVGCYLHGDGLANVVHSDGLGNFTGTEEYKAKLAISDTDFPKENRQFDMVVSNPPYSVQAFKQNARNYYTEKDFELYSNLTDNSSEIECLFIERTSQLLKDGGLAGVVLPSSILSNTGIYSKAREVILKNFDIVAIAELGSNTFMATGTNTVTLFLRRRNNYDSINLKKSVDQCFISLRDVTLNGIEKPIQKYLDHTWETISFEDYKTLLQKQPNDEIQQHELYQEYQKKIKSKSAKEKWDKILSLEADKLLYFILAFPQKIVLIKSGEKAAEKQFLGYEFSNRRGSEGIHPIQRGKSIDECTSLFDPDVFDNPKKASTYIYKAFKGDFEFPIDEHLEKNITRINLVDMLNFDRVEFDKTISLFSKNKIKVESKWNVVSLRNVIEIISGGTPSTDIPEYWGGDIPWLSIADFNNDSRFVESTEKTITKKGLQNSSAKYLNKSDIVISARGTVGAMAQLKTPMTFNQSCYGLRGEKEIRNDFLYFVLKSQIQQLKNNSYGAIFTAITIKTFSEIKVPLPPIDIQEKIVSEIEELEQQEKKLIDDVRVLKDSGLNLLGNISNSNETKLENIALLLKRGKSPKYGSSEIQIIKSGQARGFKEFDFTKKHYVDDAFLLDERKLEKGDILINSSGVGTAGRVTLFDLEGTFVVDSHITILRPNEKIALPDFILYSLANIGFKNIEAMAMGQSGQIELTIKTIENIKIPLPRLSEQQTIVSEIEKIESKIVELEDRIKIIPNQKDLILKKHL